MKKRIFIVVVVILLSVCVMSFFRKFIIFNNIERNLEKYRTIDNYYIKVKYITGQINDNDFVEYIICDNIKVINQENQCTIEYSSEEIYIIDREKNVYLKGGFGSFDNENFYNIFYSYFTNWVNNENSILGQIKLVLKTQINLEEYNNKMCYKIKVNEEYVYIDTNTLLIVARGLGESILEEYEIKFNDFDKEVFMKEKLLKYVKEIE